MTAAKEVKLTGRVPREAIAMLEIPRLPANVLDGFKALVDPTGTLSDAMDRLGLVGVIEGVTGVSNMGGQSATIGHRQDEAGAVIDGSIRDPDASRAIGHPIWCRRNSSRGGVAGSVQKSARSTTAHSSTAVHCSISPDGIHDSGFRRSGLRLQGLPTRLPIGLAL